VAVAVAPNGVKESGESGFQFEIAHRRRRKSDRGGEGGSQHDEREHEHNHDEHDNEKHDLINNKPTRPAEPDREPDFDQEQDNEREKNSPFSPLSATQLVPIPRPRPNYHDPESERTQLASWLKQCPSLQTVMFLSGAEWYFLAEGAGGGVWVNSYD
jgi:hypothetical protein